MPFNKVFDDIYKLGIKSTCEELETYCERVDEQVFQGSILDRILNQISKADIIVADLSGKNANVFFEVGYAKALDKKLILLTNSVDDIPFDLKHYTHVVYDNSIINLKENLKKHLQFYLANPDKNSSEMVAGINLSICGEKLIEGDITEVEVPVKHNYVALMVENISGKTLESNSFQLVAKGDETEDWTMFDQVEGKKAIENNNDTTKWAIYNVLPIFHAAEYSYPLCQTPWKAGDSKLVEISIFSNNFNSSYKIKLVGV